MARFHQDALPRFPWQVFIYVDINDLRMRMYLQHRRCFPLPAIGEKRFIYEMFGGPYPRAFLLTATIFCRLVGMDKGYKRSKFQPNRTTNKWVIKSQNIGYSSPTLDCLFESNATFTDWNETCARWKAWGHESLGQLDENSESLVFEFWALKVDIYQCLTPNNLLTDSPIFLKNIINCKYGPKVSLGTIFNPIGEGHLLSFSISLFIRRRLQTHFQPLYLHMYCMQRTPIWHKYVPP